MIKAPRFLTEYSNYKIREIENNTLMQQEYKTEKLYTITRAYHAFCYGHITIDEAIRIINEA